MKRKLHLLHVFFKTLCALNICKTLIFNFRYFNFGVALKFPVLIYRKVKLLHLGGSVLLDFPIETGAINIGKGGIGIFDKKHSRAIWQVSGQVVFKGKANIGQGSKISVGNSGRLTFGENFSMMAESSIICFKSISFGADCLLSWDILIMDTDFHPVYDHSLNVINHPRPIVVGNHVWIGCRSTLLKGITIADNVVVSSNSVLTKSALTPNSVIGGIGSATSILKSDITWDGQIF